jgi:regulatory protein
MKNRPEIKTFDAAKEYALNYISYRPRSVMEVSSRLKVRSCEPQIIKQIIAFMKEYNYLDDEAFTKMWIRSRINDVPSGKRKIFAELVQKGVAREIVDRHLEQISPDKEEEMALSLVIRRCRRGNYDIGKLKGFLFRRGFSIEIINRVLVKVIQDTPPCLDR